MIEAITNEPFSALLYGSDPGEVWKAKVIQDDVIVIADNVAVVEELDAAPGSYEARFPAAPAQPGNDYVVIWSNAATDTTFADELIVTSPRVETSVPDLVPSVNDLAVFLKARTRTRYGQTVGTFNDSTPVTAEEAQAAIAEAVTEVALAVGPDLPDGPESDPDLYRKAARSLVLLLSSMNVEGSLVPDQITDPRSAYAALERRYNALRKALIEGVTEARGGSADGGGESVATSTGTAHGTFPEPMTTMDERW